MKILRTLPRHAAQLAVMQRTTEAPHMAGVKYICIVVDGPESLDRALSYASDFNTEDTHKILSACMDHTR